MRQIWGLLRAAILQMAEWRPSNLKPDVAINPSASDIIDAGLGDSPARKMELLRVAADMRALEMLSRRR